MRHWMMNTLLIFLLAGAHAACGESATPPHDQKTVEQKEPEAKPEKVTRPMLLLGIDGATWNLMDPLLAAGRLPNFQKLIDSGVRAPLKTYEPTLSPLIWTTIGTGFGPHKHGINGFTAPVPGTDETALVTSNMRKTRAMWDVLSKYDHSVGVVGWWATYPAEEVKGFVISDQASNLRGENYRVALNLKGNAPTQADPARTWPSGLADELKEPLSLSAKIEPKLLDRFLKLPPERLAEVAAGETVDKEDILSIFKFAYLIDKSFIDASIQAAKKHKPEVLMIYLNGLDAAEHHFWKYIEPKKFADVPPQDVKLFEGVIDEYYIYMDEVLGRYMELYPLDSSAIMVMSDHGHEANIEYDPASDDHYDRVCSGGHEDAPDGIFILAGKDVKRGVKIEKPNVFDITPTTLWLMGVPVSGEMKGKRLEDAIDPEFAKTHPVQRVKSHGPNPNYRPGAIRSQMNDALKEKLKALGYIK